MTVDGLEIIVGAGLAAAVLAGAVLAFGVRRIHPGLPFLRTWLYYAVLFAFLVGVVLVVGLT